MDCPLDYNEHVQYGLMDHGKITDPLKGCIRTNKICGTKQKEDRSGEQKRGW